MNQQQIDAIAQLILALSDEERQRLEDALESADFHDGSFPKSGALTGVEKSFRVAELAQDIRAFEEKYCRTPDRQPSKFNSSAAAVLPQTADSGFKNSFLRVAQSLQLEGPEDLSENLDHYLYGLPKQDLA